MSESANGTTVSTTSGKTLPKPKIPAPRPLGGTDSVANASNGSRNGNGSVGVTIPAPKSVSAPKDGGGKKQTKAKKATTKTVKKTSKTELSI